MELDRYVADLRGQLAAAAENGGEDVQAVAERLSVALDAAARLMLLEVLSDAASGLGVPGSGIAEPQAVAKLPPGGEKLSRGDRDVVFQCFLIKPICI